LARFFSIGEPHPIFRNAEQTLGLRSIWFFSSLSRDLSRPFFEMICVRHTVTIQF